MLRSLIILLMFLNLNSPTLTAIVYPNAKTNSLLSVESIPLKDPNAIKPAIDAKGALLMDLDTGILLYEKNSDQKLPMASLTKIMTAVIILDSHSLDEIVTVKDDFNKMGELGVKMWLQQYEKITVGDLLIGLLVPSAGDAAIALATYHSGSVKDFVNGMNEKAKILNLRNTHFTNPIGLDENGHYSSAYDLAILTKYALRNKDFRRIVQMQNATVTSVNGAIEHKLEGTDELLNSYLDIRGVKTGTTDAAGQSVVNLARNTNGKEVIVVLLNSPSRFQESKEIIDWGFRNFKW